MSKNTAGQKNTSNNITGSSLYLNNITDSSGNSVNQIVTNLITTMVDPNTDDLNILALQTGKANLSGGNTFSGVQSFSSIPTLASDLTGSINSDNQLVSKKFVDNSIGSATNSILSSNNVFTGSNQFNNGIGVQNTFTASMSGIIISTGVTLSSLPRLTIDASPNNLRDLTPRKYVDDQNVLKANLSGGNTFSGTQTYNNVITYGSDLTSSINDNNHLVNKKYVDDQDLLKSNLSGGNTFSGTQTFNNVITYGSDLTNSITNNNHLVNKKYVDNAITNEVITGNNTYSGTNLYTKLISYTTDLTASITDNRQIPNKKYVDNAITNEVIEGNNTYSGTNQYTKLLGYTTDLTGFITDNRQIPNKKYVDDSFTTFKASNNTFTGTTEIANSFTVSNVMSCSVGGGLSYTFLPRLQSVITPSNEKDLATKKYIDDLMSSSISSTKDTYVVGLQTKLAPNSTINYFFISPPANTPSFDCYINFPSTSSVNTLYSHTCTFDFNYFFTQANAISSATIASVGSGISQTYQVASLPAHTLIQATSAIGTNPINYISCKFCVSIRNGFVYVNAPYQSTTIWTNPSNAIDAVTSRGIARSTSMKYGTTQGTYSYQPINITYASPNKVKISVLFPLINYNVVSNDPRQSGWIDSCGCSIKLNASNPCSATYNNDQVITPSIFTNSESGGAYLSLS